MKIKITVILPLEFDASLKRYDVSVNTDMISDEQDIIDKISYELCRNHNICITSFKPSYVYQWDRIRAVIMADASERKYNLALASLCTARHLREHVVKNLDSEIKKLYENVRKLEKEFMDYDDEAARYE